jgi:acetyltransferase-like isoleucine patch superfamily enzyme
MSLGVKSRLASFRWVRAIWGLIFHIYKDIQMGRFRGVVFVGLGNLLPDFLGFCVLRSICWRLAGVQLADYSTTTIRAGVFTEYPSNLVIGSHFHVNRNSYLGTNGPITIGSHVTISLNCSILTISHAGANHEVDVVAPVIIKSHCLIYANCTVLPGTVLEEGVVLAAGSVVRGGTKPWSVYAGVPAQWMKFRDDVPRSPVQTSENASL